jgi:23S rRNA pseudouridine2604 synthase
LESSNAPAPRREGGFSRSGPGAKGGYREGRAPSDTRARPMSGKRPDTASGKPAPVRTAKPVKAAPASEHTGGGARTSLRASSDEGLVRLSKRMSELGLCSRREADEWIENGWVRVDGERIDTLGTRVHPNQHIEVTRDAQAAQSRQVTILLHKPVGYVSSQAEDGYEPAVTLITAENRWEGDRATTRFVPSHLRTLAPAGRLDIDSTGLLVLTQDGRIAKQLIGEHSSVEKEYLVRVTYGDRTTDVAEHFPADKLALLRFGLSLDGAALKAAKVSWQNGEQLRFVLREGKKRQIRRMCELVGLQVVGLKRVRMGSVALGALPQGKWRYLLPNETF